MAKRNQTAAPVVEETEVDGSTMELTGDLKELAVKQLKAFAKDEKQMEGKLKNLSNHLLVIGKKAFEAGGKEKGGEVFKAMCAHAERTYAEEQAPAGSKPQPISQLLPSWRYYKSFMLAGFRSGLDISKYDSVYAIQKDTKPAKRKPGGQTNQTAGKDDAGPTVTDDEGKAITISPVIGKPLTALYDAIRGAVLRGLSPDELADIGGELAKLASYITDTYAPESEAEHDANQRQAANA